MQKHHLEKCGGKRKKFPSTLQSTFSKPKSDFFGKVARAEKPRSFLLVLRKLSSVPHDQNITKQVTLKTRKNVFGTFSFSPTLFKMMFLHLIISQLRFQ